MNRLFAYLILMHAGKVAAATLKIPVLCCLGLLLSSLDGFAHNDSTKVAPVKLSPRISLSTLQINGDSIMVRAEVKTKQGGSFQPVDFEKVKFFDRNDSLPKQIGETLTDDRGIASLMVGTGQLTKGEDGSWTLGTTFEGNDLVKEGDAEVSVMKAGMSLSGEKEDTVLTLRLKLFAPNDDNQPIPDVEVAFYVKRYFSDLKIGEGITDKNGEAAIECPRNLPGDGQGNIILIGKAEDLEGYGAVSAMVTKDWGIPEEIQDEKTTRALWSHAPPLWMVVTFSLLMTVVWGHYIVIIIKLFRLRNQ